MVAFFVKRNSLTILGILCYDLLMNNIGRQTKKCPRCGEKALLAANKCAECGLVFARMNRASNTEAKNCIKNKEYEKVIYTNQLPMDLNKWRLLLYCIFGGMFGLHSFYVGRNKRGIYSAICFAIIMTVIIIPVEFFWSGYDAFMSFFSVFGGIMGLMWLYDIVLISIEKFKVPVALKPEAGRE